MMPGKWNGIGGLATVLAVCGIASSALAQSGLEGIPPHRQAVPRQVRQSSASMPRVAARPQKTAPPAQVRQAAAEEPLPAPAPRATHQPLLDEEVWDVAPGPGLPTPSFVHQGDDFCGAGNCCPPIVPRLYANVEALLWWTSGDRVPALVTTAPVGTPIDEAGALGNPDTRILFGNEGLSDSLRGGVRFTLGTWLGECTQLEASYFGLAETHDDFSRNSDQTANLSRPFLNINDAINDFQRVSFLGDEGEIAGAVGIDHASLFQGVAILTKHSLVQINGGYCGANLKAVTGYRFLSLDESLNIRTTSIVVDDPSQVLVPGTQLNVNDRFSTENTFNGSVLGLATEFSGACWSLDTFAQVAIGRSRQEIAIRGGTTSSVPGSGTADSTSGGLFAQPSNIGHYSRNELAFVPEFGAKLHYRFRSCWQVNAGYNFLYWSQVARPGEQIDVAVNTSQLGGGELTGAARPNYHFRNGNFWAHGLSLGLECEF